LAACPASPENDHACKKSYALRVDSIHHGSTVPEARGENNRECVRGAMRDRAGPAVDSSSSFKNKAMLASHR
jgi:hypothetical protein